MPAARSWLLVCDEFAVEHAVSRDVFELLFCFRAANPRGGPPPLPEPTFAGDFAELERTLIEGDTLARVSVALREDVDAEQAELFARRIATVDRALAELGSASARLLRVGLRQRLASMLAVPGPRAVRVRALADFYYSQLACMCVRESGPTLAERVAGIEWRAVAPGLEHARIAGPTRGGPVHINLLRADPLRVGFEVHDCRPAIARGLSFASHSLELGAIAAVSGGFFLYSEPDIEPPSARFDPVGLLLDDGRVISPPVFRRGTFAIDERGRVLIERLGLEACTLRIESRSRTETPTGGHHVLPQSTGPELAKRAAQAEVTAGGLIDGQLAWNRSHGRIGVGHPSVAIVGDEVVAVGRSLAIPLNGFVVPLGSADAPAPGDRVRYEPMLSSGGVPLRAAIAGGPMLIEHGRPTLGPELGSVARSDSLSELQREEFWSSAPPVTFSQDETGDRNLLPRLAAGLDCDGRVLFAAVDGRNFEHALGMTLADMGALLLELECHTATNLDGGSSKRMVVRGAEVDLASTEVEDQRGGASAQRPVHTGVFLFTLGKP